MWNVLCLLTVVLVGNSHQSALVGSSIKNVLGEVAHVSTAYGNHGQRKQNITVKNGEPPVTKSFVPPRGCVPCTCGVLGGQNRVLDGKPTYPNQYPWMAMLTENGEFSCGATLINNKYVLTAAHCVFETETKDMGVRLLEHDWSTSKESKHIDFKVLRVLVHEKYDHDADDNDVALLSLDTEGVDFGPKTGISPVCMPPAEKSFAGYMGVVTGWGVVKVNGSMSDVLRGVRVPIISQKSCSEKLDGITENMICAGHPSGGGDACQYDSGGPLHISINSVFYLAGVVSFGKGCGAVSSPGVYARVNRYLDWVAKNTKDACTCSNP